MFVRSLALGAMASLSLVWGAQASSWDGYYIGVMGVYGAAESDTTRTVTGTSYFANTSITAIQNASAMSLSEEAFGGGGQIGLNVPIGEKFILGFEADVAGFGNEMSGTSTVAYPCCVLTNFTTTNTVEQSWVGTGRVRFGYATDRLLVYATGGYAGADVKFTQTFSDTFGPIALQTIETSEFLSGYSLGAGLELMVESGVSLRIEYLYFDLGEIASTGLIANATTTSAGTADVTDQFVRAGLSFRID
ncbi:MAG: outer membrane beta-barrel protein [Micropepsaceae bacterium]